MEQTYKLAKRQEEWETEQGGLGFRREVSLAAAAVAARAAEWAELVVAEVQHLLARPDRLEVARQLSRSRVLRRRRAAVARIKARRSGR